MSKQEQNLKAQKIKKELKRLGVKLNMKVCQEVGSDTISIFISDGVWEKVENGYIVCLGETGEIERLTYEEYTTIFDEPTEKDIAEYLQNI